MISQNIIEDLKYRNSIDDVISSYVTLTRSGANMKGLCPFHSEKTPSFTVFSNNGSFYCFGCGAGGDVISFIMRIENLDYRAALEFLAQRSGITLPDDKNDDVPRGPTRSRILEMNLAAARFFRETLFSDAGAAGREYFAKRRLSSATIKHFGLGYAPNSYDALKKHLLTKGFTEEEMVAGYLCQRSRKNEKNTYDCFRNRVMFPIIDVLGNVVAFGGRVLDDSVPKYLNSSDTPAFKKSRNLFALNFARNYSKENFILCEGYMDVIALHAAGFQNAVATLGTAITPDQARIMKKYTDKVIISYDSDDAGQRAADKALRLLGEAGIEARVLAIPGAKDPDEYIKTYGAVKFAEVLKGSKAGFDHKIAKVLEKYDVGTSDGKMRAARTLCSAIAELPSKVERDIYSQSVAKALELDIQGIKGDVQSIIRRNAKSAKQEQRSNIMRTTSGIGDRTDPDYAKNPTSCKLERELLGMLLQFPEFIKLCREKDLLSEDMFFSSLNRRIFAKIMSCGESFNIGLLNEDFTQDEISLATRMVVARKNLTNSKDVFFEHAEKLKTESDRRKFAADGKEDLETLIKRRRQESKQ